MDALDDTGEADRINALSEVVEAGGQIPSFQTTVFPSDVSFRDDGMPAKADNTKNTNNPKR